MFEKNFKIVSNSSEHLAADRICEALLHYFTLDSRKNSNVFFGVFEKKKREKILNGKIQLRA